MGQEMRVIQRRHHLHEVHREQGLGGGLSKQPTRMPQTGVLTSGRRKDIPPLRDNFIEFHLS